MADDTQGRQPTTDEVRTAFACDWQNGNHDSDLAAQFDRWLAAHDAEVAAWALQGAAKWAGSLHDVGREGHPLMMPRYPDDGRRIAEALRASADELGQP